MVTATDGRTSISKSARVVALIPAREGSKGIPNKNVARVGKHPLLAYSIATALKCPLIDDVIVSTDSDSIAAVAKQYGAAVPFLRPKEISTDTSLDSEFVAHYLEHLKERAELFPGLIVHLRPTTPFRPLKAVSDAIRFMLDHPSATALRSMQRTHLTPYKMFANRDGFAEAFLSLKDVSESYNLPRQRFEDAFIPNGLVDVLRPEVLLETGLLHGDRMRLWETPSIVDIDDMEELERARSLVSIALTESHDVTGVYGEIVELVSALDQIDHLGRSRGRPPETSL